jgi:hypothetical protein
VASLLHEFGEQERDVDLAVQEFIQVAQKLGEVVDGSPDHSSP